MRNIEVDSNHYMRLNCIQVKELWLEVESWIRMLGMVTYHLTGIRKIIGYLKIVFILDRKKIQSMLDGKEPNLYQV